MNWDQVWHVHYRLCTWKKIEAGVQWSDECSRCHVNFKRLPKVVDKNAKSERYAINDKVTEECSKYDKPPISTIWWSWNVVAEWLGRCAWLGMSLAIIGPSGIHSVRRLCNIVDLVANRNTGCRNLFLLEFWKCDKHSNSTWSFIPFTNCISNLWFNNRNLLL